MYIYYILNAVKHSLYYLANGEEGNGGNNIEKTVSDYGEEPFQCPLYSVIGVRYSAIRY